MNFLKKQPKKTGVITMGRCFTVSQNGIVEGITSRGTNQEVTDEKPPLAFPRLCVGQRLKDDYTIVGIHPKLRDEEVIHEAVLYWSGKENPALGLEKQREQKNWAIVLLDGFDQVTSETYQLVRCDLFNSYNPRLAGLPCPCCHQAQIDPKGYHPKIGQVEKWLIDYYEGLGEKYGVEVFAWGRINDTHQFLLQIKTPTGIRIVKNHHNGTLTQYALDWQPPDLIFHPSQVWQLIV